MIWWDGLVSGLRVHLQAKPQALVRQLDLPDDYRFTVRSVKAMGRCGCPV